ncbi:MAG: hypothetical protein MJA31_14915 [Clostridia bacterium]|nr:hypothetical protein [Clostridia bacterium]
MALSGRIATATTGSAEDSYVTVMNVTGKGMLISIAIYPKEVPGGGNGTSDEVVVKITIDGASSSVVPFGFLNRVSDSYRYIEFQPVLDSLSKLNLPFHESCKVEIMTEDKYDLKSQAMVTYVLET